MSAFRGVCKLTSSYTKEVRLASALSFKRVRNAQPQICSFTPRCLSTERSKNNSNTTFHNSSPVKPQRRIYYWYLARPLIAMGIASIGCYVLYYFTKEASAKV